MLSCADTSVKHNTIVVIRIAFFILVNVGFDMPEVSNKYTTMVCLGTLFIPEWRRFNPQCAKVYVALTAVVDFIFDEVCDRIEDRVFV